MVFVLPGISWKPPKQIKPVVFYQRNVLQPGRAKRISVLYAVSGSERKLSVADERNALTDHLLNIDRGDVLLRYAGRNHFCVLFQQV